MAHSQRAPWLLRPSTSPVSKWTSLGVTGSSRIHACGLRVALLLDGSSLQILVDHEFGQSQAILCPAVPSIATTILVISIAEARIVVKARKARKGREKKKKKKKEERRKKKRSGS